MFNLPKKLFEVPKKEAAMQYGGFGLVF